MILEADIESFFDSIDRPMLREMLQERIADKSLHATYRKVFACRGAGRRGVFQAGRGHSPGIGPIAHPGKHLPALCVGQVVRAGGEAAAEGQATLIRYADDFVICFEHREDAERVMAVLGKRLGRFNLRLHPDKTRLIDFRRPPRSQTGGKGSGYLRLSGVHGVLAPELPGRRLAPVVEDPESTPEAGNQGPPTSCVAANDTDRYPSSTERSRDASRDTSITSASMTTTEVCRSSSIR